MSWENVHVKMKKQATKQCIQDDRSSLGKVVTMIICTFKTFSGTILSF